MLPMIFERLKSPAFDRLQDKVHTLAKWCSLTDMDPVNNACEFRFEMLSAAILHSQAQEAVVRGALRDLRKMDGGLTLEVKNERRAFQCF